MTDRFPLLIAGALLFAACNNQKDAEPEPSTSTASPRTVISPSLTDKFSGQNALNHIKALEEFGPRPPQSAGYAQSLRYLETTLKELGWALIQPLVGIPSEVIVAHLVGNVLHWCATFPGPVHYVINQR